MSCPLSLSFLVKAIKPWDEDAMIMVSIEEGPFGIVINQLVFKDDITQVCKMQRIGATTVTLYIR